MSTEKQHRSHWKGERRQLGPRLPVALYDAVERDAKAAGTTRADWLVHLAAVHSDRPDLDPAKPSNNQEMLMTG
ncbi:MAG: hypothetical protein KDA37_16225 [Planctomycetales bacterium]|nr:hypothetical protein [Planctomycetales bacterium]